jgi:hypothetical protein
MCRDLQEGILRCLGNGRVDVAYKNTQNVRRFLAGECGPTFKFDRDFMAWIANGRSKNMGEVVDEWLRRHSSPDG